MRKLACLSVVLLLTACSSPTAQPEQSSTVVASEVTTESSIAESSGDVVKFNTEEETTFPVPVFDTYRYNTSWGAIILIGSDNKVEYREVDSLEALKESGYVNIFHDTDGYIRGLFDTGATFTAFGISDEEQSAFKRGKRSAILRYTDDDWTVYAAVYAYADDITIVALKDIGITDLSIGYNGQVLNLDGEHTSLVFEVPETEPETEESVAESESETATEPAEFTGNTEGVEYLAEDKRLVIVSSSGKVHTFNLDVDNYEVVSEEDGIISIHNMDSDLWLSIQAFSDVYESDSEPLIEFRAGYLLYEVTEGQYVLSSDDNTPWLVIVGDDYGVVEEYCRGLVD